MTNTPTSTGRFPLHDEASAPQAARPALAAARADFGMIPNLERTMATAPELLEAYVSSWALFEKTSLSPAERQVVYMTANLENDCDYCIAWHSKLAAAAKLPKAEIGRLRAGADLDDPRLRALQAFTRAMIHRRGNPLAADLEAFVAAGFTPRQALEVVLGLAIKTMSNYTNGLTGTPLDSQAADARWTRPALRHSTRDHGHG